MTPDLTIDTEYKVWLGEIKLKIRTVQIKAAASVNLELLRFYWSLGADIVARQATGKWGGWFPFSAQPGLDGRVSRNEGLLQEESRV